MALPSKIGTVQTIDMDTGEVIEERKGAMTVLPGRPGTCPDCHVKHPPGDPHNQQSLSYQVKFHAAYGRYPTWTDAMAHCTPEVRAKWAEQLLVILRQNNLPIPPDLQPNTAVAVATGRRPIPAAIRVKNHLDKKSRRRKRR